MKRFETIDISAVAFAAIALFIIILMLLPAPAFPESWKAVTKDREVKSKQMVRVKKTVQKQEETVFTLKHLYARKAAIEADLAEVNALISQVEPIADTVELAPEE